MTMKKFSKDKEIYRKIGVISLPIIVQNIIDAAVNSVDVLMLNSVGQSAISATSLATYYSNFCFMILYGIGTGVSMLGAQYWGKGDKTTVEKVSALGLRISISVAVVFTAIMLLFPTVAMKVFTSDAELIELGATYLRFVAPAIIFWCISTVYLSVLRCIGKTSLATLMEILALVLNVSLNAVFIFGLLGMPKMGIAGVAIATSIARFLQFVGCLLISVLNKNVVGMGFRFVFAKMGIIVKDFISMAIPAIMNDLSWSLAFSMYGVILGHLGTDAVAANSITNVIRNLGTVLCYGLAGGSGIVVGQILGTGNIEEGIKAGKIMFRLSVYAGLLGGAVVLLLKPVAISVADVTEGAKDILNFMLWINSYYILGTAVNTTLIAGIFRAGGDSKFGLICDTVDMWAYAVPLGLIAAFVLKLPIKWVYFLLCTDEFVKWPWVLKHYFSNKWAKDITRDEISKALPHE